MNMESTTFQESVSHFMDLLEQGSLGPERLHWIDILMGEKDRFEKISERIARVETAYAKCSQRIREQRARLNDMGGDDARIAVAKRTLANMVDILRLVQSQRDRLKAANGQFL
jgi:hypothetical protein